MARGKGKSTTGKRKARSASAQDDGVPQVFREMLQGIEAPGPPTAQSIKRRRVGSKATRLAETQTTAQSSQPVDISQQTNEVLADDSNHQVQTTFDSSDDSDEENFEWENVNLESLDINEAEPADNIPESLSIVVGLDSEPTTPSKRKARKPLTIAERKMRLDTHKVHFLCLLYHCLIRNHWCNDSKLQVSSLTECIYYDLICVASIAAHGICSREVGIETTP
jgi:xeroderma pigmentosum group C-complementing protein